MHKGKYRNQPLFTCLQLVTLLSIAKTSKATYLHLKALENEISASIYVLQEGFLIQRRIDEVNLIWRNSPKIKNNDI